jgi:hypothetical protein
MNSHQERYSSPLGCPGLLTTMALSLLFCFLTSGATTAPSSAGVDSARQFQPIGPGNVVVTPKFGGYLVGFGIDTVARKGC